MRAMLVLTVVLSLFLAGCTTEPKKIEDDLGVIPPLTAHEEIFAPIVALMDGVPCKAEVTADTSKNLKYIANASWERGGSAELDIKNNLALAARGGGFSPIDITDPLHPIILSNYTESKGNLDVKFSPDNLTALVGTGTGIDVVDITDPADPKRASFWNFPKDFPGGLPVQNAHMLFAAAIKGEQWVFLAPNTNTGVWILKLEGPPATRTLKFVTTTLPVQGGPLGPHDMVVQWDEFLKMHILYSADGYHGWSAFDVNDPAKPTLIGGFVRPESGYTHTIQAYKMGSRRMVATIAEVGANFMEIYDATNIKAPILVATWQVGNPSSAQHNFNIVQNQLYLAHYGHGIFVFDLTELPATPSTKLVDFKPVAHYKARPDKASASYWDVLLKDGLIYTSGGNGVDIVGYGCVPPGAKTFTSIN